jgi:hypothetical protein
MDEAVAAVGSPKLRIAALRLFLTCVLVFLIARNNCAQPIMQCCEVKHLVS